MSAPIPTAAAVAAPTRVPTKTMAALIGFLVVAL